MTSARPPREPGEAAPDESLDSPEADRADQLASVGDEEEGWTPDRALDAPDDVSEGDAVEQHQEVGMDEDEYRA
ncbi:hypothetical protein [Nocardiopsis potens]|uniref:hypothetical protein n=1 Tax=Nocardiopsis potens TaxID=1246458 RepID=UPI000348D92A|nr:hypothetical protein [Nocardiopsis potens]